MSIEYNKMRESGPGSSERDDSSANANERVGVSDTAFKSQML